MDSTQIDRLFQAFSNDEFKTIIELADLSAEDITNWEKFAIENEKEIFRNIGNKIKDGDYNHFLEKINDEENIDLFIYLLRIIGDKETIKKIIIEREKRQFTPKQLYNLATAVYRINDINEDINLINELKLTEEELLEFILDVRMELGDTVIKPKIEFENKIEKLKEALEKNDYEYAENFINEKLILGAREDDEWIDYIIATNDYSYMLNIFQNQSNKVIWNAMFEIKAKEIIEDKLRGKEVKINGGTNADILTLAAQDIDYIKEILANPEKRKILDITDQDVLIIISNLALKSYAEETNIDREKLKEIFDSEFGKLINKDKNRRFKLRIPENMKVGIEIESEGEQSYLIEALTDILEESWICKTDGTVPSGLEVCSPILTRNNEESTEKINKINGLLIKFGQYSTEKCGGHIHIGADYLTTLQSWKNLIELWANTEKILYIISNKAGELPREGIFSNALPISKNILAQMEEQYMPIESKGEMISFLKSSQYSDYMKEISSRNYGINCSNIHGEGINTVEFRLPNGTVEPDVWIQNIDLFGGIIAISERMAHIQETTKILTPEERKILKNFEKIKQNGIAEEEKMQALLELVIPEEDRNIYINRYKVNRELLHENPDLERRIEEKIAKKPIILDSLIKKSLYAYNPFTGQGYFSENNEVIRNDTDDWER